jgi:hypothetical protein
MDDVGRDSGRLALAVGAVAAGSAVSLATYFAVGGPFGTINDIGNACVGVLSAGLAWRLRRQLSGPAAGVALAGALLGAAVTVAGSALVVSGSTGFFLAGLVSGVGFAGIGGWLIALNRMARPAPASPRRLPMLGVAAGALMALGIVAAPGVLLRIDDMGSAPAWVWIGSMGWLGSYVAYPVWAIRLGIVQARQASRAPVPSSRPA